LVKEKVSIAYSIGKLKIKVQNVKLRRSSPLCGDSTVFIFEF